MSVSPVTPWLRRTAEAGVLLFFTTLFVARSGYSWVAVILLLAGVWMLAGQSRTALSLTRADRVLLWTLAVYGVVMIAMTLYLGNRPREMDHPARALLVIPIFLLSLRVPVRQTVFWAGCIAGCVLSAVQSWLDVYLAHTGRAMGYLNPIHFGEYALVFAGCCAAGLLWAHTQGRYAGRWRLALVLGMVCGLAGMASSGSRGAWVTLPVVVLVLMVFVWLRCSHRQKIRAALLLAMGVAVLAALSLSPDSVMRQRYDDAVSDVTQYRQSNGGSSVGARFEMWRAAVINLAQRPMSGWRMGDYHAALENLVHEGRVQAIVLGFKDNLHNTYLHAWVFFGLPGLLALLALSGVPLWYFGRKLRDPDPGVHSVALCGVVFIVSYLGFDLTQSMLMHSSGIMFFLLMLVILWGTLRDAERPGQERDKV